MTNNLAYDSELAAWIRAQLDADEELIQEAAATPFGHPLQAPWEDARMRFRGAKGNTADLAVARFANPKRILADIAAKRAILDLHPTVLEDLATEIAGDCRTCAEPQPCLTIRALAQAFDLPDAPSTFNERSDT